MSEERERLRELAAKRWTSLTTSEAIEYDDLAGRLAPRLDAALTACEAERDKAIEEMRANDRASVEAVRLAVENALRERDEARKALSAAEALSCATSWLENLDALGYAATLAHDERRARAAAATRAQEMAAAQPVGDVSANAPPEALPPEPPPAAQDPAPPVARCEPCRKDEHYYCLLGACACRCEPPDLGSPAPPAGAARESFEAWHARECPGKFERHGSGYRWTEVFPRFASKTCREVYEAETGAEPGGAR